jgi:hypothetical protein
MALRIARKDQRVHVDRFSFCANARTGDPTCLGSYRHAITISENSPSACYQVRLGCRTRLARSGTGTVGSDPDLHGVGVRRVRLCKWTANRTCIQQTFGWAQRATVCEVLGWSDACSSAGRDALSGHLASGLTGNEKARSTRQRNRNQAQLKDSHSLPPLEKRPPGKHSYGYAQHGFGGIIGLDGDVTRNWLLHEWHGL